MNNLQIVQSALEILLNFLKPFVEDNLIKIYGDRYMVYLENGDCIISKVLSDKSQENSSFKKYKDVLFYLNGLIKNWSVLQNLFVSPNYALSLCHSIKYFRNKWAHQDNFSYRETHRLVDEVQTLLELINVNCLEIDNMRKYTLEVYFREEVSKFQANKSNNFYNINLQDDSPMLDSCSINYSNYQKEATIINTTTNDNNALHEANFQKILKSSQNNPNDKYIISYFDES
jgi:hypothetical protein